MPSLFGIDAGGGGGVVDRPALRYYGGKWLLAPWIISHFPEHGLYCEPYAGAASVLLQKARSKLEVYNDLDSRVVNFFRVLRDWPAELGRMIELTPWSRAEFEGAEVISADALEDARRFYVRSWQSIAGPTAQWRSGWRWQRQAESIRSAACRTFMSTRYLQAVGERLRGVQIECDDAIRVIERCDGPGTLFYVDPPYLCSTRTKWGKAGYRHEMETVDHEELAEVLHGVAGYVVLSGYPSGLYQWWYERRGWLRQEIGAQINSNAEGGAYRTEVVWLSPRTRDALERQRFPLFAGVEMHDATWRSEHG